MLSRALIVETIGESLVVRTESVIAGQPEASETAIENVPEST
ncbi:MAG: hypothetical protein ACJAZ3_002078 [Sphingobacteriales bacterium]|jgi:hypothetical protein